MSGREFFFLMLGAVLASALRNRQGTVDGETSTSAEVAERDRRILVAMFRSLFAKLLLGLAAIAVCFDLYIVYRLIVWRDPWETGFYLLLPGLPVASVLLAWLGLVELLGYKHLPRRLGRACRAVTEVFRSPAPKASKPKPAGPCRDLD